jgi:shikimate dehydrogenase
VENSGSNPNLRRAADLGEPPALYGVAGQPISQSRSPFIHGLFARQTGQRMIYRKFEVAPEAFRLWVHEFFRSGGKGLNVTLPHKQAAAELCAELTPRAERAGAANTLSFKNDHIVGDNTDGAGLVCDLRDNMGVTLTGSSVLILGAGGATRGVLAPLLTLDPRFILIANRTAERAQALAGSFGDMGPVRGCGFEEIDPQPMDIIINATSAGLTGESLPLDPLLIGPQTLCYDMVYGRSGTPFTRWAREHGCGNAVSGWGMLVEQAAESFQIWRGVRPDTQAVIAILAAEERRESPNAS